MALSTEILLYSLVIVLGIVIAGYGLSTHLSSKDHSPGSERRWFVKDSSQTTEEAPTLEPQKASNDSFGLSARDESAWEAGEPPSPAHKKSGILEKPVSSFLAALRAPFQGFNRRRYSPQDDWHEEPITTEVVTVSSRPRSSPESSPGE